MSPLSISNQGGLARPGIGALRARDPSETAARHRIAPGRHRFSWAGGTLSSDRPRPYEKGEGAANCSTHTRGAVTRNLAPQRRRVRCREGMGHRLPSCRKKWMQAKSWNDSASARRQSGSHSRSARRRLLWRDCRRECCPPIPSSTLGQGQALTWLAGRVPDRDLFRRHPPPARGRRTFAASRSQRWGRSVMRPRQLESISPVIAGPSTRHCPVVITEVPAAGRSGRGTAPNPATATGPESYGDPPRRLVVRRQREADERRHNGANSAAASSCTSPGARRRRSAAC